MAEMEVGKIRGKVTTVPLQHLLVFSSLLCPMFLRFLVFFYSPQFLSVHFRWSYFSLCVSSFLCQHVLILVLSILLELFVFFFCEKVAIHLWTFKYFSSTKFLLQSSCLMVLKEPSDFSATCDYIVGVFLVYTLSLHCAFIF